MNMENAKNFIKNKINHLEIDKQIDALENLLVAYAIRERAIDKAEDNDEDYEDYMNDEDYLYRDAAAEVLKECRAFKKKLTELL